MRDRLKARVINRAVQKNQEEALLTFNAGNCCGDAHLNQVNDTGFFRAMTDDIGRRYKIDGKRIFATGLSNGDKESLRYGNVDPPTKEISATKLMWEFFKKHPKE